MFLRKRTCRSWFSLSGPIVCANSHLWNHATFVGDALIAHTPAPAHVILDVEQNWNTRSCVPHFSDSARTSSSLARLSVKSCTAYALSRKIRNPPFAVFIEMSARSVSSEYVMPVGLWYGYVSHMPTTDLFCTNDRT